MKKTLVLDLDSTLCNFTDAWCEWIFKKYGHKFTSYDISTYDWPRKTLGPEANDFFKKDPIKAYREWIKPIPMAFEFIRWCQTCNLFKEVYILTHANDGETVVAKEEFVKNNFGNIKVQFFNEMNDKYKHLNNCILVDDYFLHHCYHSKYNNGVGILFNLNNSYGWCKIQNYVDLHQNSKEILNRIFTAYNYNDVISILLSLELDRLNKKF